ncbi:conserved hypothetical protein [Leishmania mexicana MHOM/GT/2001/U1103]|uniref:BRCT domain-containing protein n=1 Tax=Leishmania mexicana (strain MHOM/GT/2001/U1103) TaxID=929439 RepID=E9AYA2_LEIMU|nr:conserved hypothetical protein [Leishmania mexicana MHOM/GT/2001/U1103]CBZ27943.1 conserved hypothetical protein [Leishmania mexicana MHOM/GT/2001/U1103]
MADRTQPLPSHTKVLAAVKPNLETRKNHQLGLHGPRRSNRDAEDRHGENRGAEEDAQTTREPQEHLHSHGEARAGGKPLSSSPSAAASAGLTCLVSFTGFRDEDEWRENEDKGHDAYGNPLAHAAGGDAAPCADSLSVCKQLVSALPGARVESKLTSSTTVLVARRGFTRKRLLAARQGIPVVLPKWVAMGCPALPASGGACGTSAAASASLHDLYAVPWLYGYAFSTTGLSRSEKAAIDSVCTAHGAVVEPSLTYKCDVLLTSTECVQALQRLLHSDREGDAAQRRLNQHLRHADVQRTDAGLMESSGAEMAAPGSRVGGPKAAWLTDKVRFALELDVPVVDYVKLFTMLRLDRLPPPTWTPGIEAVMHKSSSKARRPCHDDVEDGQRQFADALDSRDFDAIVNVCRVGAPAGGSSEWARILSVFTDRGDTSTAGCGLQSDGGAADDSKEDRTPPAPLDSIALRDNSMQSCSSCTDSASTVSDLDAWEELLSCALASSLDEQRTRRADAYRGFSSSTDVTKAADHLTGTTPTPTTAATTTTTVSPPLQAVLERLTVNTADVEDLANADAEEPSTLQVLLPDYYSATTGSGPLPRSSSQGRHARQEVLTATADATWGSAAVDPSPRWTTNALLHREPALPRRSSRTDEPVACGQRDEAEAAALRQHTAVPYAMHCSAERFPPQLPARDAVAISREAAPRYAAVMRPDDRVAALSQAIVDSGELLAATQDLVESCVAVGGLELASAQQLDACETRARGATAARQALPLLAMHPPYLTICVLGCTELELRKTARWCEQCRLLRSPVPTSATDIVLLGSRLLTKKRYTMRSAVDSGDDERGTKGDKKWGQPRPARHRSALSPSSFGANRHRCDHAGHGAALTIRYWEMDASVARALADVCGIPRSRMAPLKWLEDSASEAQKACEAAKLAAGSEAAQRGVAHALAVDSEGRYTDTCWTAATTPPETLVALLEEHLAAATESEESAALARRPLFHPLPPLSPDQLPDMADLKYYIRLRQAPATWASNLTPIAGQGLHDIAAGAASAGLESRAQVKRSEMHHSAHQALSNSAKLPASRSAPVEEDNSLAATTSLSAASVQASTASPAQQHRHEEKTSLSVADAQHSFNEALETAGRRFNQLIALFRVSGDGGEAHGSAGAAEVDREGRDRALAACYFCCVEGEYTRVDWAVVRGLIRYGGGRVEKRAAHDWQTLMQQQPSVAVTATSAEAQQDQQAQCFARALRRGVAYAKLRKKLRRVMENVEAAHQTSRQTPDEMPSGCNGAVGASADAEQANAAEVARLTAKLQLMSPLCQQAPVLCLLPHSFQRAPEASASPCKRLHALHRLPAVTMDYVLACVAVGYCLNPHSCFLFEMSIPSAPDMRLFHHQPEQRGGRSAPSQKAAARHTGTRLRLDVAGSIVPEGTGEEAGQRQRAGAVTAVSGCVGPAPAPPCRPVLSSWVLERRYSKTDSVGVCISVLWKLPTPPAAGDQRCWSRIDAASPPATTATIEPRLTPDASLLPLLRVLLLGFRNAVEALGGHVADTFSPSAVTHVVSVDVGGILSGTLGDAFTSDVVGKRDAVVGSSDGDRLFPYWPMESIESVARCAARDEVSLVVLEWLAACVEWGAFVDEAGYAPPADLLALVQAEKQKALFVSAQAARTAVHRRAAQAQRPPPPWRAPNHRRPSEHRDHVAAPSPANPEPSGALTAHATDMVPHLERHRKRMRIPPLGASESGAPHTPPHPGLLDYGSPPDRGDNETEAHNECRTPVMRRVSTATTTWCDSGVEPCTPPVRDAPPPGNVAQHRQQSLPPQPLSSPVPPPPCPQMLSSPHSASQSMSFRACSAGTPSAGDHGHHRQHRRRCSSSASQHNTRSLLEQQDAEAYVEHLGNLFNFFSPGSTPLPSSAHRWRERSIATHADPDADTPQRLRSTSSPSQCTQVLTPSKTEATLQVTAAETPGSTVGASHVLSTPRRRTLRGAAAATAAYTSSATKNPAPTSPDKQRRRTEELAIDTKSSVADLQRWRTLTGVVDGSRDAESAAPGAGAPPPPRSTLPNLLGGSTELSRGGTVEAKADDVSSATAISCEEADAKQRQPQGGDCTGSVWSAQTPDELAEGRGPKSIGMVAGTAQQHKAEKRSRAAGGQQGASHARVQVELEEPRHSGSSTFSWMHDVIPDSQQQRQDIAVVACADAELMNGDVLVPTTFIEATAEAYGQTAAGSGPCKDAATPLLAGDCEEAEHEDDTKGVSPAPDVIDTAPPPPVPRPTTSTGTTTSLEHKAVRHRLGSCSAPRRPSSPPYQSPPSTTMVGDVYGGANVAEEEPRSKAQCAHTDSNAQGLSPWSRHRPLSLSRRPSPLPAPATSPSHTEPAALGAGTAAAIGPRATLATSCTWECLRIYVLHDLPHREARMRRCEEALEALMRRRDGVEPRPHIGVGLRTAEPPVKAGDHCSSVDVAPDPSLPLWGPRPAPPLRFVARCEDADVLVTHQMSLRESVLVAVAAGCWVVRPGFLECVVAVLDGACCWSDKSSTTSLMRNPWPTLQLQPQRHQALATAAAAPMKVSAFCVARLRKALPTYEWTVEVLPRAPASGCLSESGSMLPLQRALVQQCRRQRQMREQAAGGSVESGDAGQPFADSPSRQRLFEGSSFVLLSSLHAVNVFPARGTRTAKAGVTDAESCDTSSRVRAIERILEAGGGCLCCSVQVGCPAADKGEKTSRITAITVTSPHVVPAAQQLLQCCVCAPSRRGQGHGPLRRGLANTAAPVVMDAALYHDLLWLVCYQVRRKPSETLYVLLDGHLLGTNADDYHASTAVYMSLAPHTAVTAGAAAAAGRSGEEADNAHLPTTSPLSEHDRISKKGRTEDVEAHDSTQPTAEPASEAATVAAGASAFPNTCTVAAWISSWLHPSSNDGSLSKAGDGPPPCRRGYAPAAAHAMRRHLCACCAAVSAVDDDVRVPGSASASYNVADVPFPVPTVQEVQQACADVGGGAKAGSTIPASRVTVRRIEFRSTGWVGACVAAGSAAVMAAAADGWMRECEAHTLWGTLFLE